MDPMANDADEDDLEACFDAWPDTPLERVPPSFTAVVAPLFRASVREAWRRPGRMERAIRGPNLVMVDTEGGLLANALCVVDDDRPLAKLHALFHKAGAERERVALKDVPVWDRRHYVLVRDWLLARPDWRTMRIVHVPFEVEWAMTIAARPTLSRVLDESMG
jgi:hypothetical protein